MVRGQRQFEHTFRFRRRTIRLLCALESTDGEQQLILEDVLATTQHVVDAVPDSRIESEALKVAFDRHARYT